MPILTAVLLAFAVTVGAQDLLRDDVSAVRHWISHLSLGPSGWVNMVNLVVTGLAICWFGWHLRSPTGEGTGRWASRWVVLTGAAFTAAGIFVSDPPPGTTYDEAVTWHGIVHDAAGGVFFIALTVSCVLTARWGSRAAGRAAAAGVALGWVVASVLAGIDYADPGLSLPSGIAERTAVACGFLWLGLVATRRTHQARTDARHHS